jgi:hypothetical protein
MIVIYYQNFESFVSFDVDNKKVFLGHFDVTIKKLVYYGKI